MYKKIEDIKDTNIQNFLIDVFNSADKEFWVEASSSSGKYHPAEDNGPGGLIRHVLKSAEVGKELSRFFDLNEKNKDIVLASCLLHDIKKNGNPWGERTDFEHGLIAYNWLKEFKLKDVSSKNKILSCVRYHMSRWTQPEEERIRAMKPTLNERIVQLSDYLASRKGMSFLPGLELTKEQIKKY